MRIRYFAETDTLYVEFADRPVEETRDLNENTIIDLDVDGNLVAVTLEHAQALTSVFDLSFQQVMPLREAVPA
jgi:uncharacterized protein YuzE